MGGKRTDRLNSLLREVISEVIREEVKNPHVNPFVSITKVEVTADLSQAKVYISIIGTDAEREATLDALQSASGFIAIHASKKIVLRHFPTLIFKWDDSIEKQMRIDSVINKIRQERESRQTQNDDTV